MSKFHFKPLTVWLSAIAIGLIILVLELGLPAEKNGSFLFTLVFWVAMAQGPIALVAAAEMSNAKWVRPIRNELLSVYPLQLFVAILFGVLWLKIDIYPWHEHPGTWLNPWFFGLRNLIFLLIGFLLARKFARAVSKDTERKNVWAALYVLAYVISQSLVAFDWIMTLERPWISTLLGAYFFIEAFYAAIALAVLICFFKFRNDQASEHEPGHKTLKDVATLMFGFGLLWVGQLFAQYLVIWYGNIPEEVSYLARRFTVAPTRELSYLVLVSLFVLPFTILLSRWVKARPFAVGLVAMVILAGIAIERIVFILPVLPLQPVVIIIEFLLMGFLLALLIVNRKSFHVIEN